ncbi:MAG: phosphoribosylamine--glycine ligase, partial [Ignisphaera sp.]
MRVLLVGSAAREHALVELMRKSPQEPRVSVVMDYRNPGLMRVADRTGGRWSIAKTTDPVAVAKIAEDVSPDLVVIGPEEPLFSGVST